MRTAAKVVAALALAVAVAGGLLVWRLLHGPIPLDWVKPSIETALSRTDGSVRVAIGTTELVWTGWRRGIGLRARAVRITGADGGLIASIPALALRAGLRALLHGTVALTKVEVFEPQLRLIRELDGRIDLGLGADVEARPENPVTRDVFDGLLGAHNADTRAAHLHRVEIVDGEVIVEDRASSVVLRAPRLHLVLSRDAVGITGTVRGDLTLGNQVLPIDATLQVQAGLRTVDAHLSFRGLNPAGVAAQLAADPGSPIARQHPDLIEQLTGVTVDLAGSIHARLDGKLNPTQVQVEIIGSSGSVALAAFGLRRVDFNGARLAGNFDAAADEAVIDQLSLDLGGPSLAVGARLSGLTTPGKLSADVTLTNLPVDALASYWPAGAAPDVREWLTSNLSRGTVTKATVLLHGTLGRALLGTAAATTDAPPAGPPFALADITGTVAFRGITVRYVPTMQPVADVSGDGTFSADRWDLRVSTGVVQGLQVGPATVKISKITSHDATRVAIAATVEGPLAGALAVLDDQPLGLPKEMGIVPSTVAGDVRAQVGFDFPLGGEIGLDNLGLDVSAHLQGVEIPHVIQGWSVTGGDLKVAVDGAGLDLDGHAGLEGTPFDVEWREEFSRRAEVRRRVTVKGQVDAAGRAALGFDLQPWVEGPVAVDLRLTQPDTSKGSVDLRLDLTPARIAVPALAIAKSPGDLGRAEGTLTLAGGIVTAVDPFDIKMPGCEVRGRAVRDGVRWRTIDATGSLGEAHRDTGRPGTFVLTVRPAESVESFVITSDDAAALVRGIDWYADGYGGRLDLTGTVDLTDAAHAFDSQVDVTNFTVTQAPTLARVLTLASLTGIQQTLMSEGVKFERISARVAGDRRTIAIPDVVAAGDSIGLAGSGAVDRTAETVTFAGSLVPAYYGINATLGKIPVLRDLLASSHGLGVLGVDFSISGPLSEPVVSVHPLQSLTPDILVRLTRLVRRAASETKSAPRRQRQ